MAINARAVVRVIIEGEWIWVERGTFTVIDFEFEDDDGAVLNKSDVPAYFFLSTNGDPYFGPLTSLSLIKLDNQILEEAGGDVAEKVKMRAIGPAGAEGESEKEYVGDFAGKEGSTDEPDESDAAGSEPVADDADDERPPIPLFAGDDDVDGQPDESDDGAADSAPKSGLF